MRDSAIAASLARLVPAGSGSTRLSSLHSAGVAVFAAGPIAWSCFIAARRSSSLAFLS